MCGQPPLEGPRVVSSLGGDSGGVAVHSPPDSSPPRRRCHRSRASEARAPAGKAATGFYRFLSSPTCQRRCWHRALRCGGGPGWRVRHPSDRIWRTRGGSTWSGGGGFPFSVSWRWASRMGRVAGAAAATHYLVGSVGCTLGCSPPWPPARST